MLRMKVLFLAYLLLAKRLNPSQGPESAVLEGYASLSTHTVVLYVSTAPNSEQR